jgi:hypothetical protein
MRFLHLALITVVAVVSSASALSAEYYTLIVCGAGGEEVYTRQFSEWGQRLRTALVNQCGHNTDTIVLLTESGDEDGVTSTSTRESILSRLRELGVRAKADDHLTLILIGHGAYRHREAKLNVVGPDLAAEDLGATLEHAKTRNITIINTASASAPFVNALSKAGRIVCTSTRSRDQVNATQFAESFIQGLENGSADLNRDDRISVWEAASQAASITDAWYAGKKLIASEQAILDDDGDGKGTRLLAEEGRVAALGDGELAKRTYLKDAHFPSHIPKAWVLEYRKAIEQVEGWVLGKAEVDSASYLRQLELLLLDAAKANKRIREQ